MTNQIVILCVLLVLSAIFSGSETAFVSVPPSKVKELYTKRKPGARTLKKLKENPHRLLITILVGNNLVNIGASAYMAVILTNYFGSSSVGITTGVMTFLLLVFGEITPKSFAHTHAVRLSLYLSKPFLFLGYALYPVIIFFELIVKLVNWLTGSKKDLTVSEDELMAMVRLGAEEGAIEKQEKELIENVLEFNDITAQEIMIPRMEVQSLNEESTLGDAIDMIEEYRHSRIPIYRKDPDHIVGILNIKDVLQYIQKYKKNKKLKTLEYDAVLKVPFSKKINVLFREFQKRHMHMAIIIDEYGGTAGIVSMEDVLEELVGEIADEFDEEEKDIELIGTDSVVVSGDTLIEEVNEVFKMKVFPRGKNSINALVLKTLGRFPRERESIKFPHAKICVQRVGENTVKRVKITLLKKDNKNR